MVKNYYMKTMNEDELVELTYFHSFLSNSRSKTLYVSSPDLAVVQSHLGNSGHHHSH